MKIKILGVVLIISLCFNLFFAVGFLRARLMVKKLETPSGRTEHVAEKLNLTASQRIKLGRLQIRLHNKIIAFRRKQAGRQKAFAEMISTGAMNPEKVRGYVIESQKDAQELHGQFARHMVELVKLLNPQQRKHMSDIFKERERMMQSFI